MREETRKKLERALWMRRLKWLGAGLAAAVAMAGVFMLESLDMTVENRPVHGVVERVGPLLGVGFKAATQGLSVDVKLDDGRRVNVMALKTTNPHAGDNVQIAEHVHGTGRVTYSWK